MTARILGGRYQLQDVIGGGGMAIVYRAVDTLLDRVVAVKMLRSQFAEDEEFVSRFRQEAQAAGRLSHPNIVNVYDVGVSQREYYIVMEYVDGPTLKDIIVERAPLTVEETLDISKQICSALQHAHDLNIIHRDVKPHNILVNRAGTVKVADFGIARAVSGNTITDKQATSVLGSVHYFSPEQARGAQTDAKSDIYSLGVVMYEMLTGSLPFSGTSPVSVALKHLREPFIEPRELNKSIPQSVENIVLRCLVKAPEGRYANMSLLKSDMENALLQPNVPKFQETEEHDDHTISIPAVGEGFAQNAPRREMRKRENRWKRVSLWSGIVVLAIAALGVGGYAAIALVTNLVKVPNVNLPSVVGKPEAKAVSSLVSAGFSSNQIQEKFEPNTNKPKGVVYDQTPSGNSQVKRTREITLFVSQGAPQISMPDVTSEPVDQAKQSLVAAGFSSSHISEQQQQSTTVPSGQVISTNPPAGSQVATDANIVLVVSVQKNVSVPNVLGMSYADAVKAIQAAGLQVGTITHNQVNMQDQSVYYIYPYNEGQSVPAGSKINMYVADNPNGLANPGTDNNATNSTVGQDGNGTGNTTGTGDAAAQPHPVSITVPAGKGQPTQVEIIIDDARGSNQVVVNQAIHSQTTWQETLYLDPGTQGDVKVYENGQLAKDSSVQG